MGGMFFLRIALPLWLLLGSTMAAAYPRDCLRHIAAESVSASRRAEFESAFRSLSIVSPGDARYSQLLSEFVIRELVIDWHTLLDNDANLDVYFGNLIWNEFHRLSRETPWKSPRDISDDVIRSARQGLLKVGDEEADKNTVEDFERFMVRYFNSETPILSANMVDALCNITRHQALGAQIMLEFYYNLFDLIPLDRSPEKAPRTRVRKALVRTRRSLRELLPSYAFPSLETPPGWPPGRPGQGWLPGPIRFFDAHHYFTDTYQFDAPELTNHYLESLVQFQQERDRWVDAIRRN